MMHGLLLGALIWLDLCLVGWLFFAGAAVRLDAYGAAHDDEGC